MAEYHMHVQYALSHICSRLYVYVVCHTNRKRCIFKSVEPRIILLFHKQEMNLQDTAIHPHPSVAKEKYDSSTRNLL